MDFLKSVATFHFIKYGNKYWSNNKQILALSKQQKTTPTVEGMSLLGFNNISLDYLETFDMNKNLQGVNKENFDKLNSQEKFTIAVYSLLGYEYLNPNEVKILNQLTRKINLTIRRNKKDFMKPLNDLDIFEDFSLNLYLMYKEIRTYLPELVKVGSEKEVIYNLVGLKRAFHKETQGKYVTPFKLQQGKFSTYHCFVQRKLPDLIFVKELLQMLQKDSYKSTKLPFFIESLNETLISKEGTIFSNKLIDNWKLLLEIEVYCRSVGESSFKSMIDKVIENPGDYYYKENLIVVGLIDNRYQIYTPNFIIVTDNNYLQQIIDVLDRVELDRDDNLILNKEDGKISLWEHIFGIQRLPKDGNYKHLLWSNS